MKKVITVILLCALIALSLSAFSFSFAKAEETDTDISKYAAALDEATEKTLKEDYYNYLLNKNCKTEEAKEQYLNRNKPEDIIIDEHFGSFDGAYVLYIWGEEGADEMVWAETVEGYTFVFACVKSFVVCKDHVVKEFAAAAEDGTISAEVVSTMYALSSYGKDSVYREYAPKPLDTATTGTDEPTDTTTSTTETPSSATSREPATTPKTGDDMIYIAAFFAVLALAAAISAKKIFSR